MLAYLSVIALLFKLSNATPCLPINVCLNTKSVTTVIVVELDASTSVQYECDDDGNKWLQHYDDLDCQSGKETFVKVPINFFPDEFLACSGSCTSYVKWREYAMDSNDDTCSSYSDNNYVDRLLPIGCYSYQYSLTAYTLTGTVSDSYEYSCSSNSITTTDYVKGNCTGDIATDGQSTYNAGCSNGQYSEVLHCAACSHQIIFASIILLISVFVFM